jgi:Protein of unknown function (DUF2844)
MWEALLRVGACFARSKLRLIMPLLALALPAAAELGGNISSIQADQEHMKGTRRVTTNAAYSVHEIQAATGTMVREFVSPSGTVFAVAWQGPATPDLQQLLGAYFDQFTQAIQTKHAGRGPVSIRQEGLVVEAGGHMRSFTGRAYLPQMMPQGVSSDAIK